MLSTRLLLSLRQALNSSILPSIDHLTVRSKSYKNLLDRSKVPELQENDLEEKFVRGSGPGGQATNKTNNAVCLKHKPTGLVVRVHDTRSLNDNRKIARERLLTRLDNLLNGEDSVECQLKRLKRLDSLKRKSKQEKLRERKEAFKKLLQSRDTSEAND